MGARRAVIGFVCENGIVLASDSRDETVRDNAKKVFAIAHKGGGFLLGCAVNDDLSPQLELGSYRRTMIIFEFRDQ